MKISKEKHGYLVIRENGFRKDDWYCFSTKKEAIDFLENNLHL